MRSTIRMAHELGLRVLAEGVEEDATHALLTRLHCDEIQGYLLARPMPSGELADWLEKMRAPRLLPLSSTRPGETLEKDVGSGWGGEPPAGIG